MRVTLFFANEGFYFGISFESTETLPSNIREIKADFFAIQKEKSCHKLKDYYGRRYAMKRAISLYAGKLKPPPKLPVLPIFYVNFVRLAANNSPYQKHIQLL